MTQSAAPCVPIVLFFLHFDVNYELLLIRGMATWDLFVNAIYREELEF